MYKNSISVINNFEYLLIIRALREKNIKPTLKQLSYCLEFKEVKLNANFLNLYIHHIHF